MNWGIALRDIVVGGAIFAIPPTLYLAWVDVGRALSGHRRRWFYVCARAGFCLLIGTVAIVVGRLPFVQPSPNSVLYVLGLVPATIGYIGIALTYGRESEDDDT